MQLMLDDTMKNEYGMFWNEKRGYADHVGRNVSPLPECYLHTVRI